MKIIKFTSAFILFFVLVLPSIMVLPINIYPSDAQPGYSGVEKATIYGEIKFKQLFKSTEDNLSAIGTSIKNPNLQNKSDVTLNIYDESNKLIRTTTINGFNIDDGSFMKIVFEPIPDSKNKKYYFEIYSKDAIESEMLQLFLTTKNDTALMYYYEDKEKEGGAPVVLYYKTKGPLNNIVYLYRSLFMLK